MKKVEAGEGIIPSSTRATAERLKLLEDLLRSRPDWKSLEDTTDRYRRWSIKVDAVLNQA